MNKLWKLLLAIGGIIGGMLLVSSKKKSNYKKRVDANKEKIDFITKKADKLKLKLILKKLLKK